MISSSKVFFLQSRILHPVAAGGLPTFCTINFSFGFWILLLLHSVELDIVGASLEVTLGSA